MSVQHHSGYGGPTFPDPQVDPVIDDIGVVMERALSGDCDSIIPPSLHPTASLNYGVHKNFTRH